METSNNPIEFFQWLYQRCERGNINFRFLRGGIIQNVFVPLETAFDDPEKISSILYPHKQNDCYFAVALREGENGKKEAILQIPSLWVDLDGAPLQKVKESPWSPSAVIETRPGRFHIYWKLRESADRSEIPKIENLLKRLTVYFQADMNATDASRILRIPGTLNFKNIPPHPVTIYSYSSHEYNLSDFTDSDLPEISTPPKADRAGSENNERIKKILECSFLQHCDKDRATLPEPEWYAMISIFAHEAGGREIIHSLSKGYPKYSSRETDDKILHSLDKPPMTCGKIKSFWNCGRDCGVKSPATLPFKKAVRALPKLGHEKSFPRETIGGLAGQFADLFSGYLESPWTFFAFNFLTCLGNIMADRVTLQSEIEPEPRLYTVNVGESADDRKSEGIKKTIRFFENSMATGSFKICYGVGSAEGLANRLKENPKTLLVFDELKTFVSKSAIDGAILLPAVNTLFEDTRFHSATKQHSIEIENVHLSLLAASTYDTYSRMWSPAFLDIGFLNRLWVIKDHGQRKYSIPQEVPQEEVKALSQKLGEVLRGFPEGGKFRLPIDEDAQAIFDDWYFGIEPSPFTKRLDGYGLRLMILFAVNEQERRITPDIVSRAVKLLQWQLEIRRELDPIDAEGNIAKVEEMIRRALSRGSLERRELQRRVHYNRYGIFVYKNAVDNLCRAGEVFFDRKFQTYILTG